MHVSSYTSGDIMTVGSANLYIVLARSSGYFRVGQKGADCLITILGSRFASRHYGKNRVFASKHYRKMMRVGDEEVLYKLLQEIEYSDISKSKYSSDSEINMKISSCGERRVGCDEEENVNDSRTCSMSYRQSQVLSDHVFHLVASLA
jgi:hypothetical protein